MKKFFDCQPYNEVLYESNNFIVVPSLGSLIEGWLLIIPKSFVLNFSCLSDNLNEEVDEIINYLTPFLNDTYGNYLLFEHGPKEIKSKVGCGVDYAHLHLVPTGFDLLYYANKNSHPKFSWRTIKNFDEISQLNIGKSDYLLYQDQNGNRKVAFNDFIPSQFFRRVIAELLNVPEKFDWKINPELDNINKTIQQYKQYHLVNEYI